MIRLLVISGALALLVTSSACTVQGSARTAVRAPAPNLVAIGGGVYVVENHSQSVFYSDGYYWMAGNGGWYRSSYYDRGWGYVDYGYVPQRVVTIRQPRSYVRFRARPGMRVHRASAVDHRRHRVAPRTRPAPSHRSNTRVPAVRGRSHTPAHSRQPATRPARPAARPTRPAARPAARQPASRPPARRGRAPEQRKAQKP